MGRFSILIVVLFLLFPLVNADDAVSVQVAYCQHMGHTIEINSENKPECVFDDLSRCDATNFYNGVCGEEKLKDITPRKEGETVYIEFEKCEEGLVPSKSKYLLDQSKCYKLSWLEKFLNFIGFS